MANIISVNISDIAIITIKNVDYRCIIHNISKSEAISFVKNSKEYCLEFSIFTGQFFFFHFLFSIYKMANISL